MPKEPLEKSGIESEQIRELARLLDETGLGEIEIEKADLRIRVARSASVASAVPPAALAAERPAGSASVAASAERVQPDLGEHPGGRPELRPVRDVLVGRVRGADPRVVEQLVGVGRAVDPERVVADEDGVADDLGDGFRRRGVIARRHGQRSEPQRSDTRSQGRGVARSGYLTDL